MAYSAANEFRKLFRNYDASEAKVRSDIIVQFYQCHEWYIMFLQTTKSVLRFLKNYDIKIMASSLICVGQIGLCILLCI